MSRFIEWYIAESLMQLGWPKSRGIFRKRRYVDTRVLDAVVEQAIQVAVGLGAGSPQRAITVLTDAFPNNAWTQDSTEALVQLLKEGEGEIERNPQLTPWKALYAEHRVAPHGSEVEWGELGDVSFVAVRGLVSAQGIFWGLIRENEMPETFAKAKAAYEQAAQRAIPSGLNAPPRFPWDSLESFFENCEKLVRDFESVRPSLPEIPSALRSRPEIARRIDRESNAESAKSTNKPSSDIAAGKQLVIVGSPGIARTVGQILGNKYVVATYQDNVRGFPRDKIGVDIENGFEPSYVIMRDKRSILSELKKAGDQASNIYLAIDPGQEGEAISWHLQTAAKWDERATPPQRVVFHEITKEAVEEAFQHPREIDMELVNAQQARRILDRLVGYQVSQLLPRSVQRGLSVGRVQSVSLIMVVDREKEIQAFDPVESWTLEAQLRKEKSPEAKPNLFTGVLHSVKGQKGRLVISKEDDARKYEAELKDAAHSASNVRKRDVKQRPTAPFTTSTMLQEAGRKLRLTPRRTMSIAQELYEGLPVGGGEWVGLITYMRTDSVQVATSAVSEARGYITETYGKDYVPGKPRVFTTKAKSAQEAHEAIRPTSIRRTPELVKDFLSRPQFNLYSLVWSRMLASQMSDARTESTTVDIEAACKGSSNVYMFRSTGSVLKFPGFRALYLESRDDDESENGRQSLPELAADDRLACQNLEALQHFTQPPPRYTEATLIKAMEEKGIGRPSTYAPTVGTLLDRAYVTKEQNRLVPSVLGSTVTELLLEFFTEVMDPDFTAKMEEGLDEVSRGEREWVPMLGEFYDTFGKELAKAEESMPRTKVEEETDEVCDTCGKPMVIKTGRFGRFLACTGFPECRTTKPILNNIGVSCPKPDCRGELVERRSRGGRRPFFNCSRYPDCDFISNQRPVPTPCPQCGGMVVQQSRDMLSCTACDWSDTLT